MTVFVGFQIYLESDMENWPLNILYSERQRIQNIRFENAYSHGFKFGLFVEPVDSVGGSVSL